MRKFFIREIPRAKPGAKGALALLAMTKNKFNLLKVNPDAKSSRFVVDLKKELPETAHEKEIKNLPKPNMETRLEAKLEKLAEINYGKYFKSGKEKSKILAQNLFDNVKFVIYCN